MLYFIITLGIALAILFFLLVFTWKNGIPPLPTAPKMRQALLKNLPVLDKGIIVELGSGWGHLLFPLAKKYHSCQIIGYENSPIPYFFSYFANHAPNIQILRTDFFNHSLHEAHLVVCFLRPQVMERLKIKLEKELKPGTQVVSHIYAIPGWLPRKVMEVKELKSNIYFYEFTN